MQCPDPPDPGTIIMVVTVTSTENLGTVLALLISERRALSEGFLNQEFSFQKAGLIIPCHQQENGAQAVCTHVPCQGVTGPGVCLYTLPIGFHSSSKYFPDQRSPGALVENPQGRSLLQKPLTHAVGEGCSPVFQDVVCPMTVDIPAPKTVEQLRAIASTIHPVSLVHVSVCPFLH